MPVASIQTHKLPGYRYARWIGFLSFTLACQTPEEGGQAGLSVENVRPVSTDDACPERSFQQTFASGWIVRGQYLQCEPDWKYNLKFVLHNQVVHRTDSLREYEFGEYSFPTLIRAEGITYVLVKRNDRPLTLKIDVFGFRSGKLDTLFTIPFFKKGPSDLDGNGKAAFYATMESLEPLELGRTGYNQILVYEITSHTIACDSAATIRVNKQVYGDFYGWQAEYKRQFDEKMVWQRWP